MNTTIHYFSGTGKVIDQQAASDLILLVIEKVSRFSAAVAGSLAFGGIANGLDTDLDSDFLMVVAFSKFHKAATHRLRKRSRACPDRRDCRTARRGSAVEWADLAAARRLGWLLRRQMSDLKPPNDGPATAAVSMADACRGAVRFTPPTPARCHLHSQSHLQRLGPTDDHGVADKAFDHPQPPAAGLS